MLAEPSARGPVGDDELLVGVSGSDRRCQRRSILVGSDALPTEHYGLGKKIMSMGIEAHKRQYAMHGTTLVLGSVLRAAETIART